MTRDKFLTEKVLGECWHEWNEFTLGERLPEDIECSKCGKSYPRRMFVELGVKCRNYNFSRWEDFGILWNFCKEQKWWIDFRMEVWGRDGIGTHFINPDAFADAIARYHKLEGE